jgi:hypothetical protein
VDDDGWVIASIPAVPGTHSQGRTHDEAHANVIDALCGVLMLRAGSGECGADVAAISVVGFYHLQPATWAGVASCLIAAGLNPKQVQTYIGHSDVRTTYNIYGHLLPGDGGGGEARCVLERLTGMRAGACSSSAMRRHPEQCLPLSGIVRTETVAIVVPAVVALAAIGSTAYQHLRGLRHQRQLVDLDNVRDVLDEAAVALHAVAYSLDDIRSSLVQHNGVLFFKSPEGTEMYTELGARGKALDALHERLSLRLGRGCEVVTAFKAADEAALGIWRAAGGLRLEPEANGSHVVSDEMARISQQRRSEIEAEREAFDSAREAFLRPAYASAGARLP